MNKDFSLRTRSGWLHQEKWGETFFPPRLLTGWSGGRSASPLGEVLSAVCHSSHHHFTPPLLHYHGFNRLICALWGEGCPIMQKWRRVIPHSCHNLVAHCGGMRPLGAFTDTAQAARADVFWKPLLSYRHSFAVIDEWCRSWTEAISNGLTLEQERTLRAEGQMSGWSCDSHQTNTSLAYDKKTSIKLFR